MAKAFSLFDKVVLLQRYNIESIDQTSQKMPTSYSPLGRIYFIFKMRREFVISWTILSKCRLNPFKRSSLVYMLSIHILNQLSEFC